MSGHDRKKYDGSWLVMTCRPKCTALLVFSPTQKAVRNGVTFLSDRLKNDETGP